MVVSKTSNDGNKDAEESFEAQKNEEIINNRKTPIHPNTVDCEENLIEPAVSIIVKFKKSQKKQKSSTNFINTTDEKKSNILDGKLLKFLIFNKIDFKIMKCPYLQDFLDELRPSSTPATSEKLFNKILDKEYDKDVNQNTVLDPLVLLSIKKVKDNIYIAIIKNDNETVFVSSKSQINSFNKFEVFVEDTIKTLEVNSNAEVIAVISDDPAYGLNGKAYWFFKCSSLRLKALYEIIMNDDLFNVIDQTIKQFQVPFIEMELAEKKK